MSKIMLPELENEISSLAQGIGFKLTEGSPVRHEIEIKFKYKGREESLYINRKSYWKKGALKVAIRPELSKKMFDQISNAGCASLLILKNGQKEAYSSNYKAFGNKSLSKGTKNEPFGHAWIVPTVDGLGNLRAFLEVFAVQQQYQSE